VSSYVTLTTVECLKRSNAACIQKGAGTILRSGKELMKLSLISKCDYPVLVQMQKKHTRKLAWV